MLYTGVTNNLPQRILEHFLKRGTSNTFAGRFHCYNLVYYEEYNNVKDAIAREKEKRQDSSLRSEWHGGETLCASADLCDFA